MLTEIVSPGISTSVDIVVPSNSIVTGTVLPLIGTDTLLVSHDNSATLKAAPFTIKCADPEKSPLLSEYFSMLAKAYR